MRRDLLTLVGLALAARIAAALLIDYPPYTDPAYYGLVAEQLAGGHGFSVPVLWSFLEVGGHLPVNPILPVASNGHWMPLTSILAAGSISLFGGFLGDTRAAQLPTIALGSALVPFTYLISRELWANRFNAWIAALLVLLAGPLLVMVPLVDSFAVFGAAGAATIWCATRAARSERPGPWLAAAGAAAATTNHGPGRPERTARVVHQMAPAPAAPKTAKLSTSGTITSSGPASRTRSAAIHALKRLAHSSRLIR